MTRVYNRSPEKAKRRRLRSEMPRAEVLLWSKLRDRQLDGLKFRRQYGVGPYVVDFYCAVARLAIEVDGDSHFGDGAEQRDARRASYIRSFGIDFLRFTNADVFDNIDGVLEEIGRVARARIEQRRARRIHPDVADDLPQSPLGKGGS